ncbi:hypothetical protein OESDEN_23710 [Oesophagostomum dentatum]|uniref:Uncharacterized protein n=1 Tax=Oesophagostomum dentatum TaxID=61180 RepID=A0A0B1S0G9_OESDE|nr:hypothetical protein OESDEN_23710 [Oesophagostomum dentatum]
MFSIPLFGELVVPTKILGFVLLILGMLIYNDIFITPFFRQKLLSRMDRSGCCNR